MKRTGARISSYKIVMLLTISGCSPTFEVRTRGELMQLERGGEIRVLTTDSALYDLRRFSFSDSALTGTGTVGYRGARTTFDGSIPFQRIAFIEGHPSGLLRSPWIIPVMAGIGWGFVKLATDRSSFEIVRPQGSCPHLYAFDGSQYVLEGEAFGTALSRTFESETFTVLPSLRPVNDRLIVRIANERPETHLINRLRLFAADGVTPDSAVLDPDNRLWSLHRPVPPVEAIDHNGRTAVNTIAFVDGEMWRSPGPQWACGAGFRDTIEATFDVPAGAPSGTLVLVARNSDLVSELYNSAGAVLGGSALPFYHALETDADLRRTMMGWRAECSLSVETLNDGHWHTAGIILPEATNVSFSRGIRIGGLGQGLLHVRLSSLAAVWMIDRLAIDFSPAGELRLRELPIVSAETNDGEDCLGTVSKNDSAYSCIMPGGTIGVVFAEKERPEKKRVYVAAAQGFLYEWIPGAGASWQKEGDGGDRVAVLALLLKERNLLLSRVYREWCTPGLPPP